MSFLQPMNFDSAFRPVNSDRSSRPCCSNGVANRAQLCRGNDAKCCRQAGQKACPCGDGAELVWDDSAFGGCGCHHHDKPCGCQNGCECEQCRQWSHDNDWNRDCDCGCDHDMNNRRQRGRDNGCDNGCNNACNNGRQRSYDKDCDDGCDNARNNRRQRERDHDCDSEQTTGMVYHVEQAMEKLFCAEQALQAGTMFPELYKPMNCADDPATNCPSKQQEKAFALWEMRLYLNTHPCDKKVLHLYRQLAKELCDPNYASTFDEDDCDADSWNWVSNPWPWECRFQRDKN